MTFALLAWAWLEYPEASHRFLTYATPTGQLGAALGQAALPAFLVAVGLRLVFGLLDWIQEYRYLQRTTAEERVLEDGWTPDDGQE